MLGLVETNLATAGQGDGGFHSPRFFFDWRAGDIFGLQRFDGALQVVAHQVEDGAKQVTASVKLALVAVGGVNAGFGGRHSEDQPTLAGVHGTKAENVTKEGAVGLWVVAIEEDVSAGNASHNGGKFIRRGRIGSLKAAERHSRAGELR